MAGADTIPDTIEWQARSFLSLDREEDFDVHFLQHLDKRVYYTVGPMASLATRFVVYPMNLVKTNIQVRPSSE